MNLPATTKPLEAKIRYWKEGENVQKEKNHQFNSEKYEKGKLQKGKQVGLKRDNWNKDVFGQ